MGLTNHFKTFADGLLWRGAGGTFAGKAVSWSVAPTYWLGLIGGSAWLPNQGIAQRSAVYAEGDYAWPTVPNGRLYRCVEGGVTGPLEPAWPTADGGEAQDGTVVWREQTPAMQSGEMPEVGGQGYARQPWVCSASAVAMDGNGISNALYVAFPKAPAAWGPVWGLAMYDAETGGEAMAFFPLEEPKAIGKSDRMDFEPGDICIFDE